MTLTDFAQTTLQAAQQNTLSNITSQVANLNVNLKGAFLTTWNNWLGNWNAGRITDKSTAPKPPLAYVVGFFDDPSTGPGGPGPYGDQIVQWAYPAIGTDPVMPMPAIPPQVSYTKPDPSLPPVAELGVKTDAAAPSIDGFEVGHVSTRASDLSMWQKFDAVTPFGETFYWQCVYVVPAKAAA